MVAELLRSRLLLGVTAAAAVAAIGLPAFRPLVSGPPGVAFGILAGAGLFTALAGKPRLPNAGRGLVAGLAFLAVGAAVEEVLWRGLMLAAAIPAVGRLAAVGISTLAFAAAHIGVLGRRAAIHLVTGTAFGGTFLVGGLPAAVAAHVAYNTLVDLGVHAAEERAR
jgi:membrane protease YdiL (CAAX protease family)